MLNEAWDPELSHVHSVLQSVYAQIHTRLTAMFANRDRPLMVPLVEALATNTAALSKAISEKRDSDLGTILARFAELGYITTGNGFYLYSKGAIPL